MVDLAAAREALERAESNKSVVVVSRAWLRAVVDELGKRPAAPREARQS